MDKFSEKINESNSSKFRIGLDMHGVIDSNPVLFSELTKILVESGNEVHIITGGSWKGDNIERDLIKLGIKWTHYFSVYDSLKESGVPTVGKVKFPDGRIQDKFEDGHWDQAKGEYCKKNNISLHLDDTLMYNEFFNTPFDRFWSNNGVPKKSHKSNRHLD